MMLPLPRILRLAAPLTAAALALAPIGALADKIKHPTARYAGLDKITGRIIAFDVAIDETVQFGTLQITPRACFTRPPTEAPLTLGFTEVDEVLSSEEYKRIFSGWMFAASPGLNALEHPVYDIWVTDCIGGKDIIREAVAGAAPEEPANATKPGTQPRPRNQQQQQPAQARPVTAGPLAPPAASPAPLPGAAGAQPLPGAAGAQPLPPRPAAARPDANAPPLPPANIPGPPRRPPSQTYFPATAEPQR